MAQGMSRGVSDETIEEKVRILDKSVVVDSIKFRVRTRDIPYDVPKVVYKEVEYEKPVIKVRESETVKYKVVERETTRYRVLEEDTVRLAATGIQNCITAHTRLRTFFRIKATMRHRCPSAAGWISSSSLFAGALHQVGMTGQLVQTQSDLLRAAIFTDPALA